MSPETKPQAARPPVEPAAASRRDLLKGAALAGTAAAAGAAAVLPAIAAEAPQEQVKARYRETDHVQRFYYLNRL